MTLAEALATAVPVSPSPSPFPVIDASPPSSSDYAAWASVLATFILLWVTRKTLKANQKMAESAQHSARASRDAVNVAKDSAESSRKAVEFARDSAESSRMAVGVATEAAAAAAAAVQVVFTACPDVRGIAGTLTARYTQEEVNLQRDYDALSAGHQRQALKSRLQALKSIREEYDEEQLRKYYAAPSTFRIGVALDVQNVTVLVHRVALVEYPYSREGIGGPPMAISRTPNLSPRFFWGFIPPEREVSPVLLTPGSEYVFEYCHEFELLPRQVDIFLRKNRVVVEYSFEGGTVKRLARARWHPSWSPDTENVRPLGGSLSSLPPKLTTDLEPIMQWRAEQSANEKPMD
uniref:hypothetical protein n=1 Tax=uncultured Micrococcus sp. TaxID=114051 RepID=UPI002626A179|nr:hypothetical protein [uncultured Micrococcus sp.]